MPAGRVPRDDERAAGAQHDEVGSRFDLVDDVGELGGRRKRVARDGDREPTPVGAACEMAGGLLVEGLPVAPVDEHHDRAVFIAILRMEEIEPMALARSIGQIKLAARRPPMGGRIPLPSGNVGRVVGNARPVIVLGLEITVFGCHRDHP